MITFNTLVFKYKTHEMTATNSFGSWDPTFDSVALRFIAGNQESNEPLVILFYNRKNNSVDKVKMLTARFLTSITIL